jgi:hypothetical protein
MWASGFLVVEEVVVQSKPAPVLWVVVVEVVVSRLVPLGQNKSELVLAVVVEEEEEQNIPEQELLGLAQNTLVPWERGPNMSELVL